MGGIKANACAKNEQRYLNALRGPQSEDIRYRRLGSCCGFKTPNSLIGNVGRLDAYELTWTGNAKPLVVYLNCYDEAPLKAFQGLTISQP